MAQVDVVRHPEIVERHQQVRVQRVPQSQLAGRAPLEKFVCNVDSVAPLRCCREPQQLHGFQMVDEFAVRGRCRMVELVDDDHVKAVCLQCVDALGRKRLDAGEDVLPQRRLVLPDVKLAEGAILHDVAVGRH